MKIGVLKKFFDRLERGIEQGVNRIHREFSFIHTNSSGQKTVRIVKGKLINDFVIDYTKTLDEIAIELEELLNYWKVTYSDEVTKQIGRFPKAEEIRVYTGSNHIDVILDGKGSLGWLTIEDHHAS